jgi:hypothetical protein
MNGSIAKAEKPALTWKNHIAMTTTPYAKLTSVVTLSAILMLQFSSGTDCILAQDAGQARLEPEDQ